MWEHLAKHGPTIRQNQLWLAYLRIDLGCLGIKLVRDPSITFLPRFRNILPESINERLGSSHSEMSETKFLREITDIIGREPGWQEEHISLRLLGNVACQPNTDLGTLGQFFDAHDRIHGNNTKKILQGPPTLRLPSPAFEDSTGVLAPYFVHTEKENRKRKSSQSSRPMTPDLGSLKRSRTQISAPVPLRSEFGDLPGFSKVPFLFASVSIATNGAVTIAWPNLDDEICAPPFASSKMLHLIKAKPRWFTRCLYLILQNPGLIVRVGIKVTEFKLGAELIPNGSGPSIASGFSMEQYEAAQLDGSAQGYVIWLFEPRCSSPVKHWSGTNEYPAWHQNKLGSTLNAFAHYVYLFSQESTVPADLQTARVVNENGEGVQVLFDIMTRTLNGLSGVGDHGKSGITGFLKKHECGNRCYNLRLSCDGFDCDEPSHEASENEA
ncbi:hypothetical protein B0H14DRAFT_3152843 [Mycena olivaceomarginata]|nr:hypothetical protein B0H14DRAFT_3152843 [Mycena olivaceomarginata]